VFQLLEAFCAVVEAGSISRATERLHLTQPAITRQLRALERELGAVLLTRTPHGVELTPVGRAVLVHAREALAAVRAARETAGSFGSASSSGGSAAPRLRIAAGLMATLYVLPPVVARFRARHPDAVVDLRPTHWRTAVERLLGYEVDAAVVASVVRSAQVRATPIVADPLLLVGPPLRSGVASVARLSELSGRTLLVLAAGTGLHDQVQTVLRRRKIAAELVEHPTAETIKSAVALGVGLSILPRSAVREEMRAGKLSGRRIADWPGATRTVQLLVRAEGRPPKAVEELREMLLEEYGGLRAPVTRAQEPEGP